jgi:hypothetical protein
MIVHTGIWHKVFPILLVLGIYACASSPNFDPIPTLEFRAISKSSMQQGEFNDSLFVELFFTDGDGDFGANTTSNQPNIFFKDIRTGVTNSYKAPFIPSQGANNGIKGTIRILLRSTCCIYPPTTGIFPCESVAEFPTNSLGYEIYISDRSGNKSNVVVTPNIVLNCE